MPVEKFMLQFANSNPVSSVMFDEMLSHSFIFGDVLLRLTLTIGLVVSETTEALKIFV